MKMTDRWLRQLVALCVAGVLEHGLSPDKVRETVEATIKEKA